MSSTKAPRTIRVALLLCDTPMPDVQKALGVDSYLPIFDSHLQQSLRTFPDVSLKEGVSIKVDGFEVVNAMAYPERPEEYDVVFMTGSAHSAYETSKPWLAKLVDFVRTICTDSKYAKLKVLGTCFGMQVIAVALGAGCEPNKAGWEIGVYSVDLAPEGSKWLSKVAKEPQDVMHIQQMHRDHVPRVPDGFQLIGSTAKCGVQGFLQYFPDDPNRIRILGLQGHPEFTKVIVDRIVDARTVLGVLDEATTEEARWRSGYQDEGQGLGVIGWGYIAVMLG